MHYINICSLSLDIFNLFSLITHSASSLLLWDLSLEATTHGVHVVPHVACVGCLVDVLLLEAFGGHLLAGAGAWVVGATCCGATHTVLEAFGAGCLTAGAELGSLGACSAWAHWHAGACAILTGVVSAWHSSLDHANSWTWLELLYWLAIAHVYCRWLILLALLIHIIARM